MRFPPHRPVVPSPRQPQRPVRRSAPCLFSRLARAAARPSVLAATLSLALAAPLAALARATEPLPPPEGETLLVVRGAIDLPNVGDEAHIGREHLESLPRERFTTRTPWTDDPDGHTFEGVRLSALLEAVGARGSRIKALGTDDYAATLEGLDFERYPIIVADTQDGEPLTLRTLGPLWIMFPFDDHPELETQANTAAAVWQLIEMDVR